MILILIAYFCFVCCCDVAKIGKINSNPGVKFSFPKKTLEYMISQVFPWLEQQIKDIEIPDIKHQKVETPIGPVYVTLDHDKISNFKISSPSFQIISDSSIEIKLDNVYLEGKADWRYEEKSFPHIKDNGKFDLKNLLVTVKIEFGGVIDSSHKSNIKIKSKDFEIKWHEFDIDVHGGSSWLYNTILSNFKETLEGYIGSALKYTIPKEIINMLQPILDSTPFVYLIPNPHNLEVTYLPEELKFSPSNNYLTVGGLGAMEHDSELPPGTPSSMPDISGDQMCQAFFNEWFLNSASYSSEKAGILEYVIQDSPLLPLNTKNFFFIPQLEKDFPNKEMQVTLIASPGTLPEFTFKSTGYYVNANMDMIFQVLNNTMFGNSQIVDVFTLSVNLTLNLTVSLQPGAQEYEYSVTGKLGLTSFSVHLKDSIVGKFDATVLQTMIQQMIINFVLPNANKYFLKGIPIPTTKYFQLINPKLVLYDGYFVAGFDFNFFPPDNKF